MKKPSLKILLLIMATLVITTASSYLPWFNTNEPSIEEPVTVNALNSKNQPNLRPAAKSVEEVINTARRQDVPPKKEILDELDALVATQKIYYEKILLKHQNIVTEYESLSSDLDRLLRDNAPAYQLKELDDKLQLKAEELLAQGKETNLAYVNLMAKYDEAVPQILAKHF